MSPRMTASVVLVLGWTFTPVALAEGGEGGGGGVGTIPPPLSSSPGLEVPARKVIPPPEPDLAIARARGDAGFYAARDASARRALRHAHDDAARMEALKLLADTAKRTGDWSTIHDARLALPRRPGPDCACDELAWRVAVVLGRSRLTDDARAWLAAVPPGSPAWADAQLARASLARGSSTRDMVDALETLARADTRDDPHAHEARDAAMLELARLRCTPGAYTEAIALLDTLPRAGPRVLDVAVARAWCAVGAGRAGDLASLLPALDVAERGGAWLPSLPVLHALSVGASGDLAGQRRGLEAARAAYGPLWGKLGGVAAAVVATSGSPDGWRIVLDPKAGLPSGLVDHLKASEPLNGLQRRLAELDREARVTRDDVVRAEVALERTDAARRAVFAVSALIEGHAMEVGWLDEHAARLLSAMDEPPPRPLPDALEEATARSAALLRGLARDAPPSSGEERGEMYARLAHVEVGLVPTETTIETLQAALAAAPAFPHRQQTAWIAALTLLDAGRVVEAEATLTELAAAAPRGPHGWQAHALLGELAFARGDYASAEAAYAAATGAPDRPLALYATYRRAWCLWALGRPSDATVAVAEVVADPATPAELRRHAQDEQALLRTCRPGLRCRP